MKFDYIIQNPPYKRSLHLEFFKKGLDLLSENGKMVIIEPAAQLYTDFGQQKTNNVFTDIFPKIEKHVYKVNILNANKSFNVGLRCPFAITYIDKSNEYNNIECNILGEFRNVTSLKDINLIGEREVIDWIFNQIKEKLISRYGSCENSYIEGRQKSYNKLKSRNNFNNIAFLRNSGNVITKHGYNSDIDYIYDEVHNKLYYGYITSCYVHKNLNDITNKIDIQLKNDNELSHPNGYTYFDKFNTFEENKKALENFKKFILTSNLAHFITIIYPGYFLYHKAFMPLFIDDDCTDESLYNMFDKSDMNMYTKAINLIEHTCDNFQKYSEFFKNLES